MLKRLFCIVPLLVLSCTKVDPKLYQRQYADPQEKVLIDGTNGLVQDFEPVDILFVIDDSGSMSSHQATLALNVNKFVNRFFSAGLSDFHIGVVNTSIDSWGDEGDGRLIGVPNFIDYRTPNGLRKLEERLIVGTSGSGTEKLFDPVKLALTEPLLSNENRGFYRPNAFLAVVFITDAEDQSRMQTWEFVQFLQNLKAGQPQKILTYAVIVPTNAPWDCARDDGTPPRRIEDFILQTKGSSFSLCDPDYGQKLAEMGEELAFQIMRFTYLSRAPMVETIRVTFGTQVVSRDIDFGWSYDPARVALSFGKNMVWTKQPKGTKLLIEFVPVDNFGENDSPKR